MRLTLSDGRQANVGISHISDVQIPRYPRQNCRATVVWIHVDGNGTNPPIHIETRAICCPTDQFNKREGRKLAREKLIKQFIKPAHVTGRDPVTRKDILISDADLITKPDRRKIYTILLPEYHVNKHQQGRKEALETALSKVPTISGPDAALLNTSTLVDAVDAAVGVVV